MRYTLPIALLVWCFSLGAQPIFQPNYLQRLDSALQSGVKFTEVHFAWKMHLEDVFEYGMGLEELQVPYSRSYGYSLVYRHLLFESELNEMAFRWALLDSSKESELFQRSFEFFKKGKIEDAVALLLPDGTSKYHAGTPTQQLKNSLFLADMLTLQQNFSAAERIYLSQLSTKPQDPELLWKIAFHYHLQNKYTEAQQYYAKGLALLTSDDWRRGAFLKPLSRLQHDTNDKQGKLLNNTLNVELWLKQKEKNPHNLAVNFLLVESYDYSLFFENHQHVNVLQQQISILESLVAQSPENVNLKIWLAQYYESRYKFRYSSESGSDFAIKATKLWNESLAQYPGSPVVLFNLAQLYSLIEDREGDVVEQHDFTVYYKRQKKLLKELEKSAASPYVNYLALKEYNTMISRTEYNEENLSEFQKLLQLEESILKVRPIYVYIIDGIERSYAYLATLSFRKNDFQKSIDYQWKRVLLIDHPVLKNTSRHYELIAIEANIEIAKALYRLNDPRKAISFYLSAIQLIEKNPTNAAAFLAKANYLMGDAHRKLLEIDLALRYYQEAAKVYEDLLKKDFSAQCRSEYDKVLDNIESLNKE